jgi:prepilin-type N-terminal cleavage/methylation domain-containing protein
MVKMTISTSLHRRCAQHRSRCGFTLIEVMMVLAIVTVLLMLAAPRFFGHLEKAKEITLRDNLKVMREAIDQYRADTGVYPDSLTQLVEKRYLKAVPIDPYSESNDRWLTTPPPSDEKGAVADVRSNAPGNTNDGRALSTL